MTEKLRVAALSELPTGTGLEVTVGGRVIAIFRTDDGVRAIDGICAHAGGPLGKGTISGGVVTCPWHGWQYDVNTGTHCLTPAICQQPFEVTIEDDDVFVEIP
ncbi:MAG: Rieske 2Fe-2S domain-containing protein [Rhodopirellula sp.]|nr:Rieske 2Fe-2S domain-containing protein [Rhodopirellula sp.]